MASSLKPRVAQRGYRLLVRACVSGQLPAPDGGGINIEKDMFELLAERYGLSPADLGANLMPAVNASELAASIRAGHATPSPLNAFQIVRASNLPPKMSSCSSPNRNTRHNVP
jgi:hypothetical protein